MRLLWILFGIFLAGVCEARPRDFYGEDELRLELSDVKHDLHSARIEITLLEERLAKQERLITSLKGAPTSGVESKLASLEKTIDKAINDLRHLNAKVQEVEVLYTSHEKKFSDLGNLKGTLNSISKAIGQETKTYTVKAGDSLEKIARAHRTTVEKIKSSNGLTKDTILAGQEIKIE